MAELVQLGKNSRHGKKSLQAPSMEPSATQTGPRVYIETYGCQMNVADSDMITSLLGATGYATTGSAEKADIILINTCAVRERAEERVYARAKELAAQKKKRRHVVLAVVGCMAEHLKERLAAAAPHVDIIAGPDSYRRLPELLESRLQGPAKSAAAIDVRLDKRETYVGVSRTSSEVGVSSFVTIQRGCDKFCTFCVVPFTRGRERGVPPREILRQTRELAAAGAKEVTLLGQTVNSYRFEDVSFADLLRTVARVDGIERIRFTSPYPVDFSDAVIDTIAGEEKVCLYVHLPLQSGSDAVLKRMRRGYTVDDFRTIVAKLRAKAPSIALSTDILSGFCAETEADHQATLDLMREIRFDSAFMFSYSERDLTFAAKSLHDDVSADVKKRRLQEIIKLQEAISRETFAKKVGMVERVLIHAPSKRDSKQMVGRSDDFKSVIVDDSSLEPGDFVDVRIERATMATLFGTTVAKRPPKTVCGQDARRSNRELDDR